MTKDEIRIAIAECLGWKWSKPHFGHDGVWHTSPIEPNQDDIWDDDSSKWAGKPRDVQQDLHYLPNYPESLDSCREFEKDAPAEYFSELEDLLDPKGELDYGTGMKRMALATPLQRCEAFLRHHNKWKGEK